jgi:hypothetical protein
MVGVGNAWACAACGTVNGVDAGHCMVCSHAPPDRSAGNDAGSPNATAPVEQAPLVPVEEIAAAGPPERRPRRRRLLAIAVATAVLAGTAVGIIAIVHGGEGHQDRVAAGDREPESGPGSTTVPTTLATTTTMPTTTTTTTPIAGEADIAIAKIDGFFEGTGKLIDCSDGFKWNDDVCTQDDGWWVQIDCGGGTCRLTNWPVPVELKFGDDLAWHGNVLLDDWWSCSYGKYAVRFTVELRSVAATWKGSGFQSDALVGRMSYRAEPDNGCAIGRRSSDITVHRTP